VLKQIEVLVGKAQRYVDRPWYPLLVAALAFLDLFIMVIPTDALMISAVLMRPRHWIRIFLMVSFGSALGAWTLAFLLQWDPAYLMENVFPTLARSQGWARTTQIVQEHGTWGMAFISVSPFPMPPAVFVLALAPVTLTKIFLSVLIGRLVKYGLFAWVASHAPRYLERFKTVQKEVAQIQHPPVLPK